MKKKAIIPFIFIFFWILFLGNEQSFSEQYLTPEEAACQHLEKGEIDYAIQSLEKLLQASPQNLNAHLYLGIALFLKKDMESASKEFQKIEKEIDRMVGASDTFGDRQAFIQMGMERKADVLFFEEKKGLFYFFYGLVLKEKNDLKAAQKKFKEARRFRYDNSAISFELIDLFLKKKDLPSAWLELVEYKKYSGETPISIFFDGCISYEKNKIEDSLAALEKASSSFPEAKKNIGTIHYNSGDYTKAREIWEEILTQNPDDKDLVLNLGWAWFLAGDSAKAQEYFDWAGIKVTLDRYTPKKISITYDSLLKERKFNLQCQLKKGK